MTWRTSFTLTTDSSNHTSVYQGGHEQIYFSMGDPALENVGAKREETWKAEPMLEARRQLNIAWPVIVTNLIFMGIKILSIMFVGHLGELELCSASFAHSMAGISGFSVMVGLGCALETLCGQAFGAKRYHLLGKCLQAAVVTLVGISIPIRIVWWNLEKVLIWVGQDPTIAKMAAQYLRALTPALFIQAVAQPLQKYLQTQSVVLPTMVCSVTTFLIHLPVCYLLVFKTAGFRGGALAVDISYLVLLLQLLAYTSWTAQHGVRHETWNGFSADALRHIWPFLRLAVPSTLMLCIQFWGYEILTFLSGLLPRPQLELSFLSIIINTVALIFAVPLGLGAAASTRVSNELGAHNPHAAKLALHAALAISAIQIAVISTSILLFGNLWARSFTNVDRVTEYTSSAMPLLALGYLFDGIQGVLSGVARGSGRQDLCAAMNLISVYGVGLPSGIFLGFIYHFGAKGLYIGSVIGLGLYTCCLLVAIPRTSWVKTLDEAQHRVTESQTPLLLPE